MANPDLKLLVNVPCVMRFPHIADGPVWSGPSQRDGKMRHCWTVDVAGSQQQYDGGEHAVWGSDTLKALIEHAGLAPDTWMQLTHVQVGTDHSWEAHVWDGTVWAQVPDPGPGAAPSAPGPEGAASSPPAGTAAPPAPATAAAAPPEKRTAREVMTACFPFLEESAKHFEALQIQVDGPHVASWAATMLIQAQKMGIDMPWQAPEEEPESADPPEGSPPTGEPPPEQPHPDSTGDDQLPF